MSFAGELIRRIWRRIAGEPSSATAGSALDASGTAVPAPPDAGPGKTGPFPSKDNFFKRVISCGVQVSEIVDVGVREGTYELAFNFPGHRHHLFEPAKYCVKDIAQNYSTIDHVLYRKALGRTNALRYLVSSSLKKNGQPTHCSIADEKPVVDGLDVVSVEEFRIERFDSLDIDLKHNYLLKVDVDGADTDVLAGFGDRIKSASVVVVESTAWFVQERVALLQGAGFSLIDIVDLAYYGQALYQLDLCFIRNDLMTAGLRPDIMQFDAALWKEIT